MKIRKNICCVKIADIYSLCGFPSRHIMSMLRMLYELMKKLICFHCTNLKTVDWWNDHQLVENIIVIYVTRIEKRCLGTMNGSLPFIVLRYRAYTVSYYELLNFCQSDYNVDKIGDCNMNQISELWAHLTKPILVIVCRNITNS